jgi:hypothetical protein
MYNSFIFYITGTTGWIIKKSNGPISFYQGGDKAGGCKRICLLSPANVYFIPVYTTGPSPTVADYVQ